MKQRPSPETIGEEFPQHRGLETTSSDRIVCLLLDESTYLS